MTEAHVSEQLNRAIKGRLNRSIDKAEVIDVRFSQEKDAFEYYIHYAGCKSQLYILSSLEGNFAVDNRRLDEWVDSERIVQEPTEDSDKDVEDSGRKTRNMKRRLEEEQLETVLRISSMFWIG